MTDDELEQIAEDSLLFWAVSCIAFFAFTGFCAGVLYPFI